ncbi:MAG: hypothetical protein A2W99_02310 [Bacteroidetes bacterium GWF2_33_16]|nr:MAG: hypothetical protein A2X00_15845 [Bacteroidetes bacterium GWE2_32_14]OFY07096.1 MAG: hypothetical protein A2W99_02310 [Bacteroidetes bacterium GWF2_33_16]
MTKTYYILVFLSLLSFYSCSDEEDCVDKKVSEANLMATTNAFLDQFVGKTIVFVDSSNNELKFVFRKDSKPCNNKILLNAICGTHGSHIGCEYLALESREISLTNSIEDLTIKYYITVSGKGTIALNDTILFDELDFYVWQNNYTCLPFMCLVMSWRGNNNIDPIFTEPPEIDTVIINRQFCSIYRANYIKDPACVVPAPNYPSDIYKYLNAKD